VQLFTGLCVAIHNHLYRCRGFPPLAAPLPLDTIPLELSYIFLSTNFSLSHSWPPLPPGARLPARSSTVLPSNPLLFYKFQPPRIYTSLLDFVIEHFSFTEVQSLLSFNSTFRTLPLSRTFLYWVMLFFFSTFLVVDRNEKLFARNAGGLNK